MGTRETRTVFFTDVVGSTAMRTTFGDDVVDQLLAAHDEVVRAAAGEYGGTVIKGTGDGSLVIFSSARAAVRAAIAMQRSFPDSWDGTGPDLKVRIAVHAGEVHEVDGDVLGEAVNAAARILDHTDGDEIVVSRVVHDLLGTSDVVLIEDGEHELRGFPEPQSLFTVAWPAENSPPRLQVRLLGNPAVSLDGADLEAFASSRLQRLLALLILQPGTPLPRQRIAFRLWPDSTETQARTNLRKVLHDLRQALAEVDTYVELDQHHLRWRSDRSSWVDVVAFREALRRGDDQSAVEFYRGDLLPDCYDDWIIEERDRLHREAGEALDRLAALAEAQGDTVATIGHAGARLRLDSTWEPAYQRLIRAHSQLGNRAEAMRLYHKCAEILEAELGLEPDPMTRTVYDQVRGRGGPSVEPDVPAVASTSLVGRDEELARAVSAWRQAAAGEACLLLVTGEAGIGKTRVVDELVRSVQGEATIARSRAYEAAGRLPWGPVVEWLRAQEIRSTVARLAPGWRAELTALLPELRADPSLPGPGERQSLDPATRRQLFDAVASALLAGGRPLLLVVDDLQWCDADTVDLIGFLIASRPSPSVLVVGTVRSDELSDEHPLNRLVAGLAREGAVTDVALAPLDVSSTASLVRRLTGEDITVDEAERLWRETAGNPLFLVEAARAGLTREDGVLSISMSPTITATIAARLGRLSPVACSVVELAATVGREFGPELLVEASGGSEQEVVDAVDELWRRRIVREQETAYDFTHDKIREVAYQGISPVRRRRLHRAVADALVVSHGRGSGPHSAQLAAHLEAAGLVSDAVNAHLGAAEHAATVSGFDEAIASCRRGLALLEQLSPGPRRDERELALRLALGAPVVARDGYASPQAQEVYERSMTLCHRLGRQVDPAILRGLGLASVVSCRFDRSIHFAEQLLALEDDPIARTEGHYLFGVSSFWRGELALAEDHLREAISSYRPSQGPIHRTYFAQDPKAICLIRLALTRLWRGDVTEARDIGMEARSYGVALEHPMTLGYVLVYTAMMAIELGDVEWLRREVATSRESGQPGLSFIATVQGLYEAWLGVLDHRPGAIQALQAAVDHMRAEHESLHLTHGLSVLARAHLLTGSIGHGLDAVHEALAWGADHDQRYADALLLRIESELLEAQGDAAEAEVALARAGAVANAQGAQMLRQQALDRQEELRTRL